MKKYTILLTAALWLAVMQQLSATTIYWTGSAGDNDWHNSANWNPTQIPIYTDDVYLSNPPTTDIDIEINSGTASCNNLFFNGTGYLLEIDKNATLDIFGDLQINSGNSLTNEGDVFVDHDLLCYGYFDNYKGGYLGVMNKLTVFTGGLFDNRGSGSKFSELETQDLDNFSTFNNEKSSVVVVYNRLNNYSTFNVYDHAKLEVGDYLFTTGMFRAEKHAEVTVISSLEIIGDAIFEDHSMLYGDDNLLIQVNGNLYVIGNAEISAVMELENFQLVVNESTIEVADVWNYNKGTIQNDGLFNVLFTVDNNGLIENHDQFTIGDDLTIDTQGMVQNFGCFEVFGDVINSGAYYGSLLSHASAYGWGLYSYTRNTGGTGAQGDHQGWHFISSPVWGLDCSIINDYFINDWDESQNTYYHYSEGEIPCYPGPPNLLLTMKGYSIKRDMGYACHAINPGTGAEIEFEGTMNDTYSGMFSIDVFGTDFEAGDPNSMNNWNLVGNPYPSAIDASLINFPPEIDQAVYYYNDATLNYEYHVGGVGQPFIPVAQGFFIHVNTPGTHVFELDNPVRTCSGSGIWYKSDIDKLLTFTVSNSQNSDKTYVRFLEDASSLFDGAWDAYKMLSPVSEIPQLYTSSGNQKYAINSVDKASEIDLNFRSGRVGIYDINVQGADDFDCLYLEDKFTGLLIDLKEESSYTFYSDKSAEPKRFVLHFDTGFPGIHDEGFSVFSKGNYVYINNDEDRQGTIEVYNMLGQLEISGGLQEGLNSIHMNGASGLYIVKLQSDERRVNAKVWVN